MARCSLINRSWLEPAVELRLGKICRRLPQDLVRLAQLTVLTLERLDPLALFCCRTRPKTLVTFGLPHPVAQCLARAADLLGNRVDRRPLRGVLALVVQDHPNRAGTDLRGIWRNSLCHRSILSRVGASDKPGAVHYLTRKSQDYPTMKFPKHMKMAKSWQALEASWS